MDKPEKHIFVCCSFRIGGEAQGVCHKKGAEQYLPYIEGELTDRGLPWIVSSAGCLKVCDRGPALVVYPDNTWYGGFESEEDIDTILDALEDGEEAADFIL
jgi:(2Fe-2S) ferredoxin